MSTKTTSPSLWLWSTVDLSIAILSTLLCLAVLYPGAHDIAPLLATRVTIKNSLLLASFLVLWVLIHQLNGLHNNLKGLTRRSLILRTEAASALGSIFFLVFPLLSHTRIHWVFAPALFFFAVASLLSLCTRSAAIRLFPKLRDAGSTPINILLIGSGPLALRSYQAILAADAKRYKVLGFVDDHTGHAVPELIKSATICALSDLEQYLASKEVDEVVVALPFRSCYDQIQTAIQVCERVGVQVTYHFQPFQHTLGYSQIGERAFELHLTRHPSRVVDSSFSKRFVDLCGALFSLVLFAPVFLLIAVAIKADSRGSIFFAQKRYGKNKRLFRMYKFRTMVPDAEKRQAALEGSNEVQGPVFKIKADPRVTRLGRFLRKTSLDELPQLLNVLRGEMSLVGPRPLPTRDVERFSDGWLMRRFSVKPGLTCLWQVKGRSNTNFEQWIAYDLEYIDTWSPMLDLKILAMTIPAVMRGRGAM